MCGTNKRVQTSKATRRVPSLKIILLGVVVANLSCIGVSPAAPSQPTATATPSYAGRLLLQALGSDDSFLGIYELVESEQGWSGPREVHDAVFDTSVITDRIIAVSPDRRHLVFAPHFLLDTDTGETAALPMPGIADAGSDYSIGGAAFSPDGSRVAYVVREPHYALLALEITSNETRLIRRSRCMEYQYGGEQCEGLGDPTWIDADTLVFAHREGLPGIYTVGSDSDPRCYNHITVANYQGDVLLSAESPSGARYRAFGETVFRLNTLVSMDAWLDASDLRGGIYEPHLFSELIDFVYQLEVSSVSPDGRYILANDRPRWRLVEVRTGRDRPLGTPHTDGGVGRCMWSPDQTTVACITSARPYGPENFLVIPVSTEPGEIVFPDERQETIESWKFLDWRP